MVKYVRLAAGEQLRRPMKLCDGLLLLRALRCMQLTTTAPAQSGTAAGTEGREGARLFWERSHRQWASRPERLMAGSDWSKGVKSSHLDGQLHTEYILDSIRIRGWGTVPADTLHTTVHLRISGLKTQTCSTYNTRSITSCVTQIILPYTHTDRTYHTQIIQIIHVPYSTE